MSRMQVHRKLKALIGNSATRYIRSFRLERARRILEERNENISEVAYSVGFGSPAYFTRCFKEEFGYPPSELKLEDNAGEFCFCQKIRRSLRFVLMERDPVELFCLCPFCPKTRGGKFRSFGSKA